MKCPFCNQIHTSVLESRLTDEGQLVRRRRSCDECSKRFTTFERVEGPLIRVVKKDGRREVFDREKLARGIRSAFHKRSVSYDQIETVVDEIEKWAFNQDTVEINTHLIGQKVLQLIKDLDKVAWIRFASVYLDFDNLKDFEKILKLDLKNK